MKIHAICSQGRVGDRTNRTSKGAVLTAKSFESRYNLKAEYIGEYFPAKNDNWRECLQEAQGNLIKIRAALENRIAANDLIFVASNTCSASLATLPVVAKHYPEAVILWFDAHGDFNTPETTNSGYLGGMVVAAVCGLWESGHGSGVSPDKIVLVGAHDIDAEERELLRRSGVRVIPPGDVTPEAVLNCIGQAKVWIHVDWDVLEPGYIPADYKVNGGKSISQIQNVFSAIPVDQVLGFEFAEYQVPDDPTVQKSALSNIAATFEALLNE